MRKTAIIVGLTIGFFMIPFLIHADIYKWTDDKGTIHFTDDYGNIPTSDRERVKVEMREESGQQAAPSRPQETVARDKQDRSKEIAYKAEEDSLREKLAAWMGKLEEATANYENAQRMFSEKAEALSQRRFGSPTQYKFDILQLSRLNAERMKYKAQFEEADGMVRRLSKADVWEAASVIETGKDADIYGMGEEWWRDRVRPWKKKLEELKARYETAERIFQGRAEELSRRGFGNRHTIKAKIIELDGSKQEVLKYETQIAETEEGLDRISKDAEESKADPDWLK